MSDLDHHVQRHFETARRATLPPDSWRRLDEKLTRPAASPPLWRRPRALAAAAAAVLLLAGVAAIAASDEGDDRLRTSGEGTASTSDAATTDPPSTTEGGDASTSLGSSTTASTTSASSTTASTTAPVGSPPEVMALLVDDNGDGVDDVVLVDAEGRTTSLVVAGTKGEEAGDDAAVNVDLAPDGRRLYYEACCEPAVGAVRAVDLTSGEDLGLVTYGTAPAVSPDGGRLAVHLYDVGIQVLDLASGQARTVAAMPGEPEASDTYVTDLAWSPDGSTLAAELQRYGTDGTPLAPQVHLVDLAAGSMRPLEVAGRGPDGLAMPRFLADGRVVVALGAGTDDGLSPLTAAAFGVVDPATGDLAEQIGGVEIGAIDATADGRWVAVTATGGSVRIFSGSDGFHDQGTRFTRPGARLAAW